MANNLYPHELMKNISWMFWDGKCSSIKEFIQKVYIYQENISSKFWDPKKIELYASDVYIHYSFWNISEEQDQHKTFLLKAQNEKYFTNGELLFKIHNNIENDLAKNGEEHIFLGGLVKKDNVPNNNDQLLYELILYS